MIESPAFKDGPSGLLEPAGASNSVTCTGRCEPLHCGEHSEGPCRDDPPGRGRASPCPARTRPQLEATISEMVERVLLASPRGYCAGVERAVETVELALEHYGPPGLRAQADRPQHPRRARPRGARRDLRRHRGRGAGRLDDRLLGARRRAVGERRLRGARPQRDRRDLPARDEGARAGAALCRGRLHRRPDRPCRPRGGRRHDGRGARGDGARAGRRRGGGARPPRRHTARLHHADDALRRRDRRDHRRPPPPLPGDPRAEEGGHLLRDLQPAVGREGDCSRRSTCCS